MKSLRKHTLTILNIALATVLGTSLTACGGDDDDPSHGTSTLSKASRPFVGLWQVIPESSKYSTYPELWVYFSKDGKARIQEMTYERSGYNHGPQYSRLHETPKSHWTYDADEKLLATDRGNSTWKVTITTDDTWAGYAQWGDSKPICNATRVTSPHLNFIATVGGTWKDKSGNTLIFTGYNDHGTSGLNDRGMLALVWTGEVTVDGKTTKITTQYLKDPVVTGVKDKYLGTFTVSDDQIVYKSGNYVTQSKYDKDKEYWNYKNVTVVNPFDYSNTYLDVDMSIVYDERDTGDDPHLKIKGRYYRSAE